MSQQVIAVLVVIYVAVTLAAPAILARPLLLSQHPRAVLMWWFIFLFAATTTLLAALIGLIGRSLMHHVTHIEGHGVLLPILDNVFGWIAIAVLGVITFRLGAAASDLRTLRQTQNSRLELITHDMTPELKFGVRVFTFESDEKFVSAIPRLNAVIISSKLVSELSPSEYEAVLKHEQAHLVGHHQMIRSVATLVQAAAPGFTASTRMAQATRIATELIADDVAARQCGRSIVAQALEKCFGESDLVEQRIKRLRP